MNKDRELFDQILSTFNNVRSWIDADYYRQHIMPTVQLVRQRLAAIEADEFLRRRSGGDTVPDRLR